MARMRRPIGVALTGATVALVVVAVLLRSGSGTGDRHRAPTKRSTAAGAAPSGARPDRSARLVAEINQAQTVIDDPSSTSGQLARAGLVEQVTTGTLGRQPPRARQAVLAALGPQAAATMRADLDAAGALSQIVAPGPRLPHWRIEQPPPPGTLLGYFRLAQTRYGVPWRYLAAIEFVETRFGRVHGLSTAGAQGPMQFLPSTWAGYGRGSIDSQRDAILAAARFLHANGAPRQMAGALYHYNNSSHYVRAVQDYAGGMGADRRAYYGYYYWQVLYARKGGTVILPIGYPRARPVAVALPR
jgi:membrane-bound lytic murein transglycosylase B